MPSKSLIDFVSELIKMYGLGAFGLIVLVGGILYLIRKNEKDRGECRADFQALHKSHGDDRNDWFNTLKEQHDGVISVVKENSKALEGFAVATKELSIHIQNCRLRQ